MSSQNPFLAPEQNDAEAEEAQEVITERLIGDIGQSQAMYNYSQKLLEQKERELVESIAMNYGRIREVERELGNLQLQLKLTSGPKKHALELLRRKIEAQNERVAHIRTKHTAAKTTFERLDGELKAAEAEKEQLCGELNTLVQQAARAQLDKLEELKATLEGLYTGVVPKHTPQQKTVSHRPTGAEGTPGSATTAVTPTEQVEKAGTSTDSAQTEEQERQIEQQREQERRRQQEAAERRRREAEAAAARSRHVSLNPGDSNPRPAATQANNGSGRQGAAGMASAGPAGKVSNAGPGSHGNGTAAGEGAQGPESVRPKTKSGSTPGNRFSGFDT